MLVNEEDEILEEGTDGEGGLGVGVVQGVYEFRDGTAYSLWGSLG